MLPVHKVIAKTVGCMKMLCEYCRPMCTA